VKLKGKFYKSVVIPTILCGSECWVFDWRIEQSSVAGMRMLRWVSRVTTEDRIRYKYVRESIGVALIVDNIRKFRIRWFKLYLFIILKIKI